jgi:hypothetical protein
VLWNEEPRKDLVVGERDDVGDAPELGELAGRLEAPGVLLVAADVITLGECIERGAQRARKAAGVEDGKRSPGVGVIGGAGGGPEERGKEQDEDRRPSVRSEDCEVMQGLNLAPTGDCE